MRYGRIMKIVDFYFDYLSPFAYLASLQISGVCMRANASVSFRPILLPALLDHWGQRGPAEIPPKAVHTYKECLRYALTHGIAFRAPQMHPFNPLLSLRVTSAAESDAARERVAHALYALGWARGADLGSASEIEQTLTAAGFPAPELLERARTPEIKHLLRAETERAIARGVFGVPAMLVDDELFWGLDQLPNLELYLTGRDPLAGLDWKEFAPRGSSAQRRGVSRS
jgi:2-hydroxychromene-2-carboxylate isomerase